MRTTEEIFAENFKKRRKELSITQRELAERIKYSEKSISKWETGQGMPPAQLLPTLADILKISIDDMMYNTEEIDYYLGIDGGGTKTEFALANKSGKVIKRIILGACNPVDMGIEKALAVLSSGIDAITDGISPKRISVFAGVAGGITGDNQAKISLFLEKYRFVKYSNGSDAQNAVAAGLCGKDGVAVIIGTGSIAFASCEGVLTRIGGYGYLFGDSGSGFSIGRDGIMAAFSDEDGSGERTMITKLILQKCGKEKMLSCLSYFYDGGKRLIADFSKEVFDAAAQEDKIAVGILKANFSGLSKIIISGIKRVYKGNPIPVVLLGGITKQSDVILPIIKEELKEWNNKCEVSICEGPVVNGALLLAGIEVK